MLSSILYSAAFVALAQAHCVLLSAQGEEGSPSSVGFSVDDSIARNCTLIVPCQLDTTIIRQSEIDAKTASLCGRTQLTGIVDIEKEIAEAVSESKITKVKAGTRVVVVVHQVNADGGGPYIADLQEDAGNDGAFSKTLEIDNNIPGANGFSLAKFEEFNVTVTMPPDLKCVGGPSGNFCILRFRNSAQAGPFGGCLVVEQES